MRFAPAIVVVTLTACGGKVVVDRERESGSPLVCPSPSKAYPSGALVAGRFPKPNVDIYPPGFDASTVPLGTLEWAPGKAALVSFAFDPCGALYTASEGFNGVLSRVDVFAPGALGLDQPVRTISGPKTRLQNVRTLAVDRRGYVYVAEGQLSPHGGGVLVFAPGANGDTAPIRTITHSASLWLPGAIAIDEDDQVYVSDAEETPILVYGPDADGDAVPWRSFGAQEALSDITAFAFDAEGTLYASGWNAGVYVFPSGANGATRMIELENPIDIAVDPPGRILAGKLPSGLAIFAPDASDDAAPLAVLPNVRPMTVAP